MNFCNYSTDMDAQLDALETKLGNLLEHCDALRMENQRLRQQIAVANDQNKQLKERAALASLRLESLLVKLPGGD